MCIILCRTPQDLEASTSPYALILAANRDEYIARPTLGAAWHHFEPLNEPSDTYKAPPPTRCLSGRDAQDPVGGTWFGLSVPNIPQSGSDSVSRCRKVLRIGALTNIHDDTPLDPGPSGKRSRGGILKDYLQLSNDEKTGEYLESLRREKRRYDGFGLGLFDVTVHPASDGTGKKIEVTSSYYSNRLPEPSEASKHSSKTSFEVDEEMTSGTWGMSNSLLSQPLEKVKEGNRLLSETLSRSASSSQTDLIEGLFSILRTDHGPITSMQELHRSISIPLLQMPSGGPLPAQPPRNVDADPPSGTAESTGEGRAYGTRLSTVVLVGKDGSVVFIERDRAGIDEGELRERKFEFRL